jgi:hypothetical protein
LEDLIRVPIAVARAGPVCRVGGILSPSFDIHGRRHAPVGDYPVTVTVTVTVAVAVAVCERGGSGPLIPVPFVRSALGCWVKEGLGLVLHIPSGCVAKINIP